MKHGLDLWIVGKAIDAKACSWEFQGVFDSKEAGIEACRDANYFIAVARLNEVLPHESGDFGKAWYPKSEPEPIRENPCRSVAT